MQKIDISSEGSALLPCLAPGDIEWLHRGAHHLKIEVGCEPLLGQVDVMSHAHGDARPCPGRSGCIWSNPCPRCPQPGCSHSRSSLGGNAGASTQFAGPLQGPTCLSVPSLLKPALCTWAWALPSSALPVGCTEPWAALVPLHPVLLHSPWEAALPRDWLNLNSRGPASGVAKIFSASCVLYTCSRGRTNPGRAAWDPQGQLSLWKSRLVYPRG